MATPKHPTLLYQLITWALFPIALIHTVYTALKFKNASFICQRLGFYKSTKQAASPVWCHCASVGEINTALPLLKHLNSLGKHLVITTNTVTGYDTLKRSQLKDADYAFLPLDYSPCAQQLLNTFKPKLCLVFETELWPCILLNTLRNEIDVAIINGRVSKKTLNAPKFILENYKRILTYTKKIISSSDKNSHRFNTLGARPNIITTLDNLKFACVGSKTNTDYPQPLSYPYLLCASTHEGEEESIVKAWLAQEENKLSLVIALRHPQRITSVRQTLDKLHCAYCLHSDKSMQASPESIYIIDTLGELMPFVAHAETVFIGGSLVPIGGHNVIEPAQYSRAILIGPHYENFHDIIEELASSDGIKIIQTAEQLIKCAVTLQQDKQKRIAMGEQARAYIVSKQQVFSQYAEIIENLISFQAS